MTNPEAVAALAEALHKTLDPAIDIETVVNQDSGLTMRQVQMERAARVLAAMPNYTLVRKDTLDNPEYDGTDAAHPAWWRGSDHATKVLTAEIERLREALEAARVYVPANGKAAEIIDAALAATEGKS